MNLERYKYITTNNFQDYIFYSEGPKGKIKKVIRYTNVGSDPIIYNLAFGDEDDIGVVSDSITSNNQDKDKVLSTVANTINTFCDHYGNHFIYAEGSTPSRTRLYQMGIGRLWKEINTDFDVWGYKDGSWQDFKINVNYEAFLVKRK
jgi:hypothetical protein